MRNKYLDVYNSDTRQCECIKGVRDTQFDIRISILR